MSIAKDLLDSIDILAADKVSSVKFDKTVRATIADKVDESIGKYKVKYQNSTFYAYDLNLKGYAKNTKVYVVIPSSDFEISLINSDCFFIFVSLFLTSTFESSLIVIF